MHKGQHLIQHDALDLGQGLGSKSVVGNVQLRDERGHAVVKDDLELPLKLKVGLLPRVVALLALDVRDHHCARADVDLDLPTTLVVLVRELFVQVLAQLHHGGIDHLGQHHARKKWT